MCGVMISHHRMEDKNLRLKLQLHKVTHISNLEVSIPAINVKVDLVNFGALQICFNHELVLN